MDRYTVRIIHTESGRVDLTMKAMTLRRAEKVRDGAEINLDHENYHVEIDNEEEEELDPPLFDDNADEEEDDNV